MVGVVHDADGDVLAVVETLALTADQLDLHRAETRVVVVDDDGDVGHGLRVAGEGGAVEVESLERDDLAVPIELAERSAATDADLDVTGHALGHARSADTEPEIDLHVDRSVDRQLERESACAGRAVRDRGGGGARLTSQTHADVTGRHAELADREAVVVLGERVVDVVLEGVERLPVDALIEAALDRADLQVQVGELLGDRRTPAEQVARLTGGEEAEVREPGAGATEVGLGDAEGPRVEGADVLLQGDEVELADALLHSSHACSDVVDQAVLAGLGRLRMHDLPDLELADAVLEAGTLTIAPEAVP